MGKIKVLDNELINKIAAGEVVERPANVVKELLENSIDAGATLVTVDIVEGGKSLVRVTDNGSGMAAGDAELCLERHSTSKIKSTKDLFSIKSLGFRGEALASIAAVSNLRLTTKTKDGIEATQVVVEGGVVSDVGQVGAPDGTTIEVRDLFFNTPVRKKYMKTITTEFSVITDIVTRYALANPQIGFKLLHNNHVVLSSPKTVDTLGNITAVYGRNLSKELFPVNFVKHGIEVVGYISKPSLSKGNKNYQSVYVNGRYVKNSVITDALYSAYHTMLNVGRHPVFVLQINVDPKKIDVNVHPTKAVIRVLNEDELSSAVYEAVSKALQSNDLIPDVEEPVGQFSFKDVKRKYEMSKDEQSLLAPVEEKVAVPEIKVEVESKLPHMIILGQVHKTYILAESNSGLLVIDQHAAEERATYEEFMEGKNSVRVQELLSPEMIDLDPKSSVVLNAGLEVLAGIGFKIEHFGDNSFIVRTVPKIVDRLQTKELVLDLVSELSNAKKETGKIREERLIRAACRKSVKAGAELTLPQMRVLIDRLGQCSQPFTCPHGRPTIINMTIKELEKKFKRVL
ncbi:DNA mismatch repair endonuclease MutL [Nanoarchaeota archaeon]